MKVKIKGPTKVKLESGRRFSASRACTADLDVLGYSDEEQKELLAHENITELADGSKAKSTAKSTKKKGS